MKQELEESINDPASNGGGVGGDCKGCATPAAANHTHYH